MKILLWRNVAVTLLVAGVLAGTGSASAQDGAVQVDPAIPAYKAVSGISGNLNSIGSDTLNNLMTLWAEGFKKVYPNVNIQIEGKGSSTVPPALIEGTAQLGPMSRAMRGTEIDQFEAKYGYKPTQLRTSLDSLAVFVHKDNPIEGLTISQVDGIFSKTQRCKGSEAKTWGEVGADGAWAGAPISLYGRNSASGTYGFFKEHALCNGDYKDIVKEQPGSASVVQGVSEDRNGVGYSGVGYTTSGVRAVSLATKQGEPFHAATYQNVVNGSYPLSRFLFIYINRAPGKPLDPLVKEFTKFVFSKEGQETVIKDGYYPLPAAVVKEELAKLE
ncbi:MAG: phosphate ABC transporter substrate-binding protein PstS family protein [Deltaproteobacteria bacterium]|nr:phosphate ABC transporter substrate-binding protein PstS family protein [Deltaproteobacteria bacterium]